MEKLSFVIPCYRSQDSVRGVLDKITETVKKDGRYDYEIICVNDYSPDNTLEVLNKAADENDKITVIDLSRNFGQHAALMAGFNYVTGDIIVCLDDDGQNPPEEMFKLIDKLNEGYDLVSARYEDKKRSLFRKFGTKMSFFMSEWLINKPKGLDLNSYYAVKRFVVDETIKYKNAYPFVQGLMLRITKNMTNVMITHKSRETGKSGYSFTKLLSLWMNGFTAFSEKPLRISSFIGGTCAAIGFIMAIIVVIRKLLDPGVPLGYSAIMSAIMFMSGVNMLILGLLGEYIGRMYICINNAPQFTVRSVKRGSEKDDKTKSTTADN